MSEEEGARLFSVVPTNRTRYSDPKTKEIPVANRGKYFQTARVVKH